MTVVNVALTKMLAVQIVGCASGNSDVALGSALSAAPTGGKRLQVPLPCTFSATHLPVATSSLKNGYQAIEDLLENEHDYSS